MSHRKPRFHAPLWSFALLTAAYLAVLVGLDSRNDIFRRVPELVGVLPMLFATSLIAYLLRYLRWHWLLSRRRHAIPPGSGLLAYLAGFAFTASPGKVGELLRIRYFRRWGVGHERVIAVFVFERLLDLVVLLLFALPIGLDHRAINRQHIRYA